MGQNIARYESNEKAKNNIDELKSVLSVNFPEQSADVIGERSYLGKITKTYSGTDITTYVLIFSIGDLVVTLVGTAPLQSSFIGYGKIIESNIMNAT